MKEKNTLMRNEKCEKANINIWYEYKKIWENKMTDTLNGKTTKKKKKRKS